MSGTHTKKVNTKMYESNQVGQVLKYNASLLTNSSGSSTRNNPIGFRIVKIESHNKNSTNTLHTDLKPR